MTLSIRSCCVVVVAGALGAFGCDSSEEPIVIDRSHHDSGGAADGTPGDAADDGSADADDATRDATGDATADAVTDADAGRDPSLNCVKPGTPSNEAGVGGYCEKQKDCKSDAGPRICTSDFSSDPYAWFCTALCDLDPQCGVGAFCLKTDAGNACLPYSCSPDDGGVADAPADGG
ncbi:MAG: hypothetical protein NVS3B10_15010 [Polyangiales bacterium]